MPVKIAIVEDKLFLARALAEKLSFFNEFSLKFIAENGADLLNKLDSNSNIDLILMDIEMPLLDGIEATALVKQRFPQIKIIMLTVFNNDEHIFRSIKAGADGYLLKETAPNILENGIKETLSGGAAMNPSIAMRTLKLLRNPDSINSLKEREEISLSSREAEVLEQLSKGFSYTRIAENLFLAPSTVRKHIENIYKKLQVHSKIEAIEKARQNNII
ncbi:LuxR family two component transcriptional regulator [Leeuwenhoekiella aestuarii]|uniref:LuxR family two component transcriptional regulator n=1 Tax=Leeuwenhoekiella aestuarii TaxID=2249426 RepID=A0A4Q0NQM3_9FLAO|nr:response regulator transcription factor [Leeuwenhoekiella aestuarii]RXG11753.1 LuxR family two component transcriptional regulator [Leeuwenhoekiella aestuarii]RXG12809.1 LuxR family two component transcriptional regulator [Leeuwenhoekiella aestuarii]